jgi:exodeoxyribonuclease VII small subunit
MGKTKKIPPEGGSDFESNIKSLETIIEKLEGNDTDLQDALSDFEKGINLARSAQKALTEAEQKVNLLLDDGDGPSEQGFLLDEEKE